MFNFQDIRFRAVCLLILFLFLYGCGGGAVRTFPPRGYERKAGGPSPYGPSVLKPVSSASLPSFTDDLDYASLRLAVGRSLQYLRRFGEDELYYFGGLKIKVKKMRETLQTFLDIMDGPWPDGVKENKIRETFDFYRSAGDDGAGRVLFTGYYEPFLNGSTVRTERYRYPLYRTPEEILRNNRADGNQGGMPRYSRAEIDGRNALAGRGLELFWVDDFVDLFFLHIQGSGEIGLTNGEAVQVGFAQSNGYPYRSIGNYLLETGALTRADLSMKGIKKFLRDNPEKAQAILNYNERYVFFRIVENGPLGALNLPVTAGRTIASDHDYYPKGALGLVMAKKPVVEKGDSIYLKPFSRFVLNQDAGAAIKGPGRIDLFCGSGEEAETVAGHLREQGELFFLLKK